jgi:hypothetical protein
VRLFLFIFCLVVLLSRVSLAGEWTLKTSTRKNTRSQHVTHLVKELGGVSRVTLHLVKFDRKTCVLRVVDLPPEYNSVGDAARGEGALAAVNGGYFQENFKPLGLVVSEGRVLQPLARTKLLSGLLVVSKGSAQLLRVGEFRQTDAVTDAVQAGPFLIDHGKVVPGLNSSRAAERTVLLADKQGVAALLVCDPVSLAQMAEILATPGLFPELKIDRALNLDGGSSTALWVDAEPWPFVQSEWKRVRNAVLLVGK